MKKIYTYARNMIYAIMAAFNSNHDFDVKETSCKPTRVDEIVCFEISQRIKDLLETVPADPDEGTIDFVSKGGLWEAEVRAGGVESYFFARMLFFALAKLESGIIDIPNTNCTIIERYTTQAVVRNGSEVPLGLVIKAVLDENGFYSVSFPIKGSMASFSNKNVDQLCMGIVEHFKERKKK